MATVLFGAGLALVLALLVWIHIRLSGLPDRAAERAVVHLRREMEPSARADADALAQAAASRVADIVSGLEAAADQVAACAVELEGIQSDAASFLMEQRAHTGEIAALVHALPERCASTAPRLPEPEDDQRKTVEMARPPTGCALAAAAVSDDEPEEEPTVVAAQPVAGTSSAPNGLRFSRTATPPPSSSRGNGP